MKNKIAILIATLVSIGVLGYIAIDAHQEAMAWKRESEEYEQLSRKYEQLYFKCKNQ